ncbi:MAG TPA: PAS domain S-box protein [Candidatus Binatia bacterium]|nr:PAS domain S-box protein [Candidatus Binatia bacterium]
MAKSNRKRDGAGAGPSESFAPKSNEPLLREAADSTPAPVWMTNSSGAVEFMNRAFSELTGIPTEEALGDAWLTVMHPDDIAAVREKRAAAWAAGHTPYTFHARFRRHDGAWRWFEVSSKPRIDADGKFHGYVGLAVDRTEARAALDALRASEERYRAVVESQADLVCRFTRDGEILFVNSAYARACGVSVDALLAANFWKWVPGSDRAQVQAMLDGLSPHTPEVRIENRFQTVDGERWMLWTNRALAFDEQGRWIEAQSTGVDIHERKQAEEHTKLLLDELNHRVKNTLAVVQGIAQQTFKTSDRAAIRAFEGRLAALSKAHSLLTDRRWTPAPLREMIADVSHVCGAARERIHTDGPDLLLSPRQALSISMALHELCTNAMKYGALSTEGGVVDLAWRVKDGAEPYLEMIWRERGGPPVAPPKERGYGSMMIERALAHDLQGSAKLEFKPDGLVCTVSAPLEG